jgi:hypothetical protein
MPHQHRYEASRIRTHTSLKLMEKKFAKKQVTNRWEEAKKTYVKCSNLITWYFIETHT